MKIAGLQKNSFVDYPGKIAAVIFTPGCNLNCYYCHNRQLIDFACNDNNIYVQSDVLDFLKKRRGFLDGVVISGGEPTLQPDLCDFMLILKAMGYLVKLDTNGTNPAVLKDIVDKNALDFIAMDLKAPLHMYNEICGVFVDTDAILESVEFIMSSGVEHEFRTTIAPQLKQEHVIEIASVIKGADLYVLQQFRKPQAGDNGEIIDIRNMQPPCSKADIMKMAGAVSGIVRECKVRGI